jgi:hypothetical protein
MGRSGTVQGWTCFSGWGATQSVTHRSAGDVRHLIQRQEQQAAVLSELTSSRSHGLGRRSSLADVLRQRPVNETQMNLGAGRWLLVTIVMLVAAASPPTTMSASSSVLIARPGLLGCPPCRRGSASGRPLGKGR